MGVEESLRDRLVTAGVDLLERTGVANLGLRTITRHAGVSHGAPRRYFPTHAALLAAIAARGFADLATALATGAELPPRERVDRVAAGYLGFATARPEMFLLMFRHDLLEGSGENLRERSIPLYREWSALVAACVSGDAEGRALRLWTGVHGVAMLAATRGLELIAPEVDPFVLVRDSVIAHLGPERTPD